MGMTLADIKAQEEKLKKDDVDGRVGERAGRVRAPARGDAEGVAGEAAGGREEVATREPRTRPPREGDGSTRVRKPPARRSRSS